MMLVALLLAGVSLAATAAIQVRPGSGWPAPREAFGARPVPGSHRHGWQRPSSGRPDPVDLDEEMLAEALADTETGRESNMGEGSKPVRPDHNHPRANPDMGGEIGLSVARSQFAGEGKTRRESELPRVDRSHDVEPNESPDLGLEGDRTNREASTSCSPGWFARDIKANNTVESQWIGEASIGFDGKGVIADKQGPGIAHRVMDHAWPF